MKTRIAFVGIFSLSASIVAAEPNLFGRWTTPAGEEMLMKSGGGSQYVGKIDEIEAFSGVLSDNGQVTGKVMGWLHDGEVKNACDETWHEMWQEGQWNLSSDGLTLSGYFEPIKVMSMPFFKMCYPEYLPKETHKYTRKKTCGPDISNSLKGVLDRVEDEFKDKGINNGERTKACELLFSYNPLDFDDQDQVINAWDILDLQLAGTKWLQHTRFTERGLGTPYDKDDIENSEGCGNSVQVGDGCYLAGTVNYSIFGLMAKLCNGHDISFSLQAAQTRVNNWKDYLEPMGNRLKGKPHVIDDPGPPNEWVKWGYNGYDTSNVPRGLGENRQECEVIPNSADVHKRFQFEWMSLAYPEVGHLPKTDKN